MNSKFGATLLTVLLIGLAGAAAATDVEAIGVKSKSCIKWALCTGETTSHATDACQIGGDNVVAYLAGNYALTIYGTSSVSTEAWSCHMYSSDNGHSASKRQQITDTALSTSQYAVSIDGVLEDVWMVCTGTLTGGVDINVLACPLAR